MKKVLMLLLIIFIPGIVYADTCDMSNISINNISVVNKTEYTEEIVDANANNKNVDLNLTMFQVGDNIKYLVKLENKSNEDYMMEKDGLVINTDHMKYTFESTDDSYVIKANSNKDLYLTVEYTNKVQDNLFQTPVYNDIGNMKINLSADSKTVIQKIVENPKTGVTSYLGLLIFIIIIGVIAVILIKKKKYSKFMMVITLGVIAIPIIANAYCKCELNINSNIQISKREPFLYKYYIYDDKITITDYKVNLAQTLVEYKVSDKNKCTNYIKNYLLNENYGNDDYDSVELRDADKAQYYAASVCSGASDHVYRTLENYVFELIPESDREQAGITNVKLTNKGSNVGLDPIIPTYLNNKPVTNIGSWAFMNKGINSVVLPDTLKEINHCADDEGAFSNNNLTHIEFPEGLEVIGCEAFSFNKITTVNVPDSVTEIGGCAFRYNNISSLHLGQNVERIDTEAFYHNQITEVTIPAKVKKLLPYAVGEFVFRGAFHQNPLRKVYIEGKLSSSDFEVFKTKSSPYDDNYVYPFEWADDVTCVKNNEQNVENGCIKWLGSEGLDA